MKPWFYQSDEDSEVMCGDRKIDEVEVIPRTWIDNIGNHTHPSVK